MEDTQRYAIETTFDHKFARDIIRFILREYMTGLHWIPTGIFDEEDLDTPFTPQLKAAVKEELDNEGHTLHSIYDSFFPDKSVIKDTFLDICQKAKDRFESEEFHVEKFISFSILIGYFAGLSYHYNVQFAPDESYKLIVGTLRRLKKLRKKDLNFWNEIQNYLENPKGPRIPWEVNSVPMNRK